MADHKKGDLVQLKLFRSFYILLEDLRKLLPVKALNIKTGKIVTIAGTNTQYLEPIEKESK